MNSSGHAANPDLVGITCRQGRAALQHARKAPGWRLYVDHVGAARRTSQSPRVGSQRDAVRLLSGNPRERMCRAILRWNQLKVRGNGLECS